MVLVRQHNQTEKGNKRMAYVYKSKMAEWCDLEGKYMDKYTDYFSSKKKAIANAVRVIKIMHDDFAEIKKGQTYTSVCTGSSIKRHYFITQQYVS